MDVTKPYRFIRFGAMDVTKPYEFIGFGAVQDIFGSRAWQLGRPRYTRAPGATGIREPGYTRWVCYADGDNLVGGYEVEVMGGPKRVA